MNLVIGNPLSRNYWGSDFLSLHQLHTKIQWYQWVLVYWEHVIARVRPRECYRPSGAQLKPHGGRATGTWLNPAPGA
jgi:hypothetical protein